VIVIGGLSPPPGPFKARVEFTVAAIALPADSNPAHAATATAIAVVRTDLIVVLDDRRTDI
jgi:hypothetical protein